MVSKATKATKDSVRPVQEKLDRIEKNEDLIQPFKGSGGFMRSEDNHVIKGLPPAAQAISSGLVKQLLQLGGKETITKPFIQSAWAYAAMCAVARAQSSVRLRIWTDKTRKKEVSEDDPVRMLLNKPNPNMTHMNLLWQQSVFEQLDGGSVWLLYTTKGGAARPLTTNRGGKIQVPNEIWPLRYSLANPLVNKTTKLVEFYEFESDGTPVRHPAHSAAPIYYPDPDNSLLAVGPTHALMRVLQMDFTAERYDEALLSNGGSPGYALKSKTFLGKEMRAELRKAFVENHQRAEEHGKVAVIPFDMDIEELGFSPKDLEFGNMRLQHRNQILATYGVTPPIIGLIEDSNRANADTSERIFWKRTILPKLAWSANQIQHSLIDRLDAPYNEYVVAYDVSEVDALRLDLDSKIKRVETLMKLGFSREHAAAIAGLELPEGIVGLQERFIISTLIPVGETVGGSSGEDDEDEEGDDDSSEEEEGTGDDPELSLDPDSLSAGGYTLAERMASFHGLIKLLVGADVRLQKTQYDRFKKSLIVLRKMRT